MSGMPIGLCCVCDEPLDMSRAGFCKTCGQGFCWNDCGEWHHGNHCCSTCMEDDDEDEAND